MMASVYKQQMVTTATPIQLITLLLDHGEMRMAEAELALEQQRMEAVHDHLVRAQQVIAELISSLDMDRGGGVAANLRRLYTFVWERLVQANVSKKAEPLREARRVWQQIVDLWHEAETQAAQGG